MKRGFTLIEIVIYIAIFALMAVFVIGIVVHMGESAATNRARANLENESEFVMGKIRWAMAGANAINLPASSSTGSTLSIDRYNFNSNPVVIQISSGTIWIARGGAAPAALTSSNVKPLALSFTHIPAAVSRPEGVSVVMTLAASSSDPSIISSTTLQSAFYLRQ